MIRGGQTEGSFIISGGKGMKSYINYMIIFFAINSGICRSAEHIIVHAEKDRDDYIVDKIKEQSNLSQADVDKWKFVGLGLLANPIALGMTALPMYIMGSFGFQTAKTYPNLIENAFSNSYLTTYTPSSSIQESIMSPWSWASGGAVLAGLVAYRTIYPRMYNAVLNKVKNYVTVCDRYEVAKQNPQSVSLLRSTMSVPYGSGIWASNNIIAIYRGVELLRYQGQKALELLDTLNNTDEEKQLREKIAGKQSSEMQQSFGFINYLDANKALIENDPSFKKALKDAYLTVEMIRNDIASQHKLAQQAANVKATQAGTGLIHAATVKTYWSVAKDFLSTSANVVKYLFENRGMIMGGIGATAIGAYLQSRFGNTSAAQ